MTQRGHQIIFQGRVYQSLKEFAAYEDLRYSRVVYYHRKGKSPEQIYEACQYADAREAKGPVKETVKRKPVKYNGKSYTSLYEAAENLGLSPGQLYYLCSTKGLSPEEAIRYAMEKYAKPGTGQSANSKPCTVEGVEYPSREAALSAYQQKRITVYSRMEREGISFEEALVQGRNKAVYRKPTLSLFPSLKLVPIEGDPSSPVLKGLKKALDGYQYPVQLMKDKSTELPALLIEGHSYVYYNRQARGVEIISELPANIDTETMMDLNAEYAAVKLFRNRGTGTIYISAFQSAKEESHDIKPLLNTWFSYFFIREILLHKYGESEP